MRVSPCRDRLLQTYEADVEVGMSSGSAYHELAIVLL